MKEYAARRQEILAEVRKRTSKNLGGVAGEYKGVELDCRKVHLAFSKIFVAPKSPIATMAIVSLLWLGVVFGCTPRGRIDNSSTKQNTSMVRRSSFATTQNRTRPSSIKTTSR